MSWSLIRLSTLYFRLSSPSSGLAPFSSLICFGTRSTVIQEKLRQIIDQKSASLKMTRTFKMHYKPEKLLLQQNHVSFADINEFTFLNNEI